MEPGPLPGTCTGQAATKGSLEKVALPVAKFAYDCRPKLLWNSSVWARINSADLKQKVEKLGSLQTHQSISSCFALFNISRAQCAGTESVCCFVFVSVEFHHRFVCVFRNFGVAVTPPQFCKSDPKTLDLGSSSGTLDHGTSVSARWGESILGWSTWKEAAAATEAACHVPANWSVLLLVTKQWRLANGHMRLRFGYGILWVNVSFFSNLHRFSSSTSRATESYDDVHVYSHMIKGQDHAIAARCA